MSNARSKTEKALRDIEKRVSSLYEQAQKELDSKWKSFALQQEPKLEKAYKQLVDAQISGSRKDIEAAKAEYERMVKKLTIGNERYKALVNETTDKLAHTNESALNYINDKMSDIYLVNYNDFANNKIKGYSFTLMNQEALDNLAKKDKAFIPQKYLDKYKDKAWNHKQINSQVFQGILQGESITKIADRLKNVTDMNEKASIRNARTMVTAAENKGKQDACEKAHEDGVLMTRKWIATGDERTRDWHAELDGVEVEIDEPWVNTLPDGTEDELMYPGDPAADPANTYNCRCTFITEIKGFAWNQDENVSEELMVPDMITEPSTVDAIEDYGSRMDQEDVDKFNDIFSRAEFVESEDLSYYNPDDNKIYLSDNQEGTTIYHEGTHWFDYNQDYTITEDYGKFKWVVDEDGNLTGEREWVPDLVTIKEHAGFSEYIAHEWDRYSIGASQTPMSEDMQNLIKKLGTSDTYGLTRNPDDVKHDLDAINDYLNSKGISKSDPDFVHLSDFISAMTYDASLGSLMTGGHDYNYWVSSNTHRVTEMTAGYNLLRATGRMDLIDVMRDLAPNLMKLIEEEWSKIW